MSSIIVSGFDYLTGLQTHEFNSFERFCRQTQSLEISSCMPSARLGLNCATLLQMSTSDPAPRLHLADFDLVKRLGNGSYAHVVLARLKATGHEYALKVIDKHYIIRHGAVDAIRRERDILGRLNHPGIVRLHFTFQDALSLYMGLEYCPNGELYDQIRIRGRLDAASARFYAAETVVILEGLRAAGVVHRDIKPENLLLTATGHLKLVDFGSAKDLETKATDLTASNTDTLGQGEDAASTATYPGVAATSAADVQPTHQPEFLRPTTWGSKAQASLGLAEAEDARPGLNGARFNRQLQPSVGRRALSLVGTADYVSPEVLRNQPSTHASDLWALGCVLYHMLSGRPPFRAVSEYLTFQKVVEANYDPLPGDTVPHEASDLVSSLLQLEPHRRLGATNISDLRFHPFFDGIDWEALHESPAPDVALLDSESLSSAASSFDWELQSLAAALPRLGRGFDID